MAITKRFASEDYVIENIKANKTELEEQISLFDKKIDVLENKKIDSPDIANPGQMIVVKTVDDTGKPTEFEAVNIPKTEGGGITVETDPTVPSWAKQPTKPNYTKSDVGLSNVDNIKQYSAENEPPYPVTSVNGKTGSVQLTASDVEARSNTWMPSASDVGALPNTTKIPSSTSDLTNNSGFITKTVSDLANYYLKTDTYSKEELDNKISAIPKFAIEVVSSLPTSNISATTVYLVVTGDEENNIYTEYIYVSGRWEYLGKQTVDLTNYVKRTELSIYYSKTEIESLLEELRNFIPTRLSQLADDSSHRTVTDAEKESWNAKSTFSGSYTDLTNKPNIPSLSGYATENFVKGYAQPAGNYLTTIPSEYVTESELSAKGYLTQHQSLDGYAKTSQIPTKTSQLTNDSDFATNESFNKIGGTVEITSSDPEKENTVLTVNPETIDEINLYSAEEIDNLIESVRNGASSGEIPSLDGYATETYVKNYAQPKGNYLSSIPSEYVTDTELNSKGYLTSIPDDIVTHKDDTSMHVVYGVCETAGDVADKVVSVNGNFILKEGAIVIVRFINANSIAAPTLNVNGTGAKPMYRYGTTTLSTGTTTTGWIAGAIQMFTYNGEGWIRDYWNNTTYSNVSLGQGYTTCSTAAATTAKTASLSSYSLTTGGIVTVKFTNAVPANATLNINSKGAKAIYYRGAKITADVIKSGDTATFIYNSYYHLISIDRWQDDIDELSSELNIVKEEIDDHKGDSDVHVTSVEKTSWNNKQPSGDYALRSEIPTVPVQSVNGKTGAVVLDVSDVGGYTKDEINAIITSLKAQGIQQTPSIAQGTTYDECIAWLNENGDTSKVYIMPKAVSNEVYGYILTKKEISTGSGYTNILDTVEINLNKRWSHSGKKFSDANGHMATAHFPVKFGDVIRINTTRTILITDYSRVHYFNTAGNYVAGHLDGAIGYLVKPTAEESGVMSWIVGYENTTFKDDSTNAKLSGADDITQMNLILNIGKNVAITEEDISDLIVTINEPIEEGGTTIVEEYAWASTGHTFIPADYEERIIDLENTTDEHTLQIKALEKAVESGGSDASEKDAYNRIKNWKYPIHEDAPVFLLEEDKSALTSTEQNTEGVYAKYDALMNANSHYITREDCGMASDGTTPIYIYHFKEPEPHYSSQNWSETKPVILVCSGVHPTEQTGVHSLYHAMEEITNNAKLLDLRRNIHFVIMPLINPTAFSDSTYGVRNPDGIQVHYNFEVDFKYPTDAGYVAHGNRNHGGDTPLSIPETQYFDALMQRYKDTLACVVSCHNNDVDVNRGTGYVWCSCATHFMCNLSFRLIDKLSVAWREKHGTAFDEGVRWANEYALTKANEGGSLFNPSYVYEQPEWDYRVGMASLSSSGGTEYKQALKYGVHGINVETCDRCMVLDKDFSKKRTANVITMGTETYINFFRTFMAVYDRKDKKDYAPNLPWVD